VNELESVLRVRSVLFEAAKENVIDSADINSTPSCVIEQGDKKEIHKGARDIISALKRLE
jgi:hypothetical protein